MRTVVETAEFQKQAKAVWSDTEREAFIDWISANRMLAMSYQERTGRAKCGGAALGWESAAE